MLAGGTRQRNHQSQRAQGGGCGQEERDRREQVVLPLLEVRQGAPHALCQPLSRLQFPFCDGSHAKHNEATGDNVGPLVLKAE